MTYPAPAKIIVSGTGPAKIIIQRGKAYYSRAYSTPIPQGAMTLDVVFPTALSDGNWVPGGFSFSNFQDSPVDIVFLQAVMITAPSQVGFTVLLSAPPPTGNYLLNWSIAQRTNP